jgi:serine protease AprX
MAAVLGISDPMHRPATTASWAPALGTGSIELARGSEHLVDRNIVLAGQRDIFGSPWTTAWAKVSAAGQAWTEDGFWNGNRWLGAWTAPAWSGSDWTSGGLTSSRWSSGRWTGDGWESSRWSASRWSASRWSTQRWSSYGWGG